MVIIDASLSGLNSLLRRKLGKDEYERLCFRYGIDMEGSGDNYSFETTSDRIEIISEHSLAYLFSRLLGGQVHRNEAIASVKADIKIEATHRPFVNLLSVKLDKPAKESIKELMAIQEKFDVTVGRNRHSAAIGMFDMSKLKFPLSYKEMESSAVSFVPLGYNSVHSLDDIIKQTDKGREYSALIGKKPIVWAQKDGSIFALPPIINADFPSVSDDTTNLLIDVTGTDRDVVNSMTTALIFNMQFFGSVSVLQPKYGNQSINPGFKIKQNRFNFTEDNVVKTLGLNLSVSEISKILKSFDYSVEKDKNGLEVTVPFYRQDVIHQVDITDDILRFVGVDKVEKSAIKTPTVGKRLPNSQLVDNIRDTIVGFGYQETDLNILTNESVQFNKTLIAPEDYAPLVEIKSGEITMARSNILPEMLRLISNNLHKKFPQNLFDIGDVVIKADGDVPFANELRLCVVSCGRDSNLTGIYSILKKVFADSFGISDVKLEGYPAQGKFSKTFIKGRAAVVLADGKEVGVVGELHPQVLNNFEIELPVSACEINLSKLI